MTMNKANKGAACSDWHRRWSGWLGTLYIDNGTATWKGHWQGRHGQKGGSIEASFPVAEYSRNNRFEVPVHYLDVVNALAELGQPAQLHIGDPVQCFDHPNVTPWTTIGKVARVDGNVATVKTEKGYIRFRRDIQSGGTILKVGGSDKDTAIYRITQ